jgi:hypothetical protein
LLERIDHATKPVETPAVARTRRERRVLVQQTRMRR